jgi:hypothetical protein
MVLAIVVVTVLLAVLALGWYMATRVKRKINDEETSVSGVSKNVQVTATCVAAVRQLTHEPILISRDNGRVAVQVGEQPMKALESVPDRLVRASLREAAVAVDAVFGPKWTAIMRAAGDSTLHVTRLA